MNDHKLTTAQARHHSALPCDPGSRLSSFRVPSEQDLLDAMTGWLCLLAKEGPLQFLLRQNRHNRKPAETWLVAAHPGGNHQVFVKQAAKAQSKNNHQETGGK